MKRIEDGMAARSGEPRRRWSLPASGLLTLLVCLPALTVFSEPGSGESARERYNRGTRLLRDHQLDEAEMELLQAVVDQDPSVQAEGLYNLSYVRYQQGVEELRREPGNEANARSVSARASGEIALSQADRALEDGRISAIVAAYLRARSARKKLREAGKAVREALQSHAFVLSKWQRAADDFRGARELSPDMVEADTNAAFVEEEIAGLVDWQTLQQMQCGQCSAMMNMLKMKMKGLKGQLPEEMQKLLEGAEGGDEGEGDGFGDEFSEGDTSDDEEETGEGLDRLMTEEEAERFLEALKTKLNLENYMGSEEGGAMPQPERTW